METTYFKTLRDTREILYYNDGVYHFNGDATIDEECAHRLGDLLSVNRSREVIHAIRCKTFTERKHVNGDKRYLNLLNGVLDIENLALIPHSPDILATIQLPIKYDPTADCPAIRKFFSEVLYPEGVPVMEEAFGYCFESGYPLARAFILVGSGSNGKTTAVSLLRAFLGDDNVSTQDLQSFNPENRFATSALYGKLANICDDLPATALKTTAIFKQLCGGGALRGEAKFSKEFSFQNRAKLIFCCNAPPSVPNEDSLAFWRRWIRVDFPNQFPEGQATTDSNLLKKLTTEAELSGLLNLSLAALKRLRAVGNFSYSATPDETAEAWALAGNPVHAFAAAKCVVDNIYSIPRDLLYDAFLTYAKENHLPSLGRRAFLLRLPNIPGGHFIKLEKSRTFGTILKGIALLPEDADVNEEEEVEKGNDAPAGGLPLDF